MTRRWLAKRPGPGQPWLHLDLPLSGAPTDQLTGNGSFRSVIPVHLRTLIAEDGQPMFWSWGTELYLEESGQIRWGGIVTWAGEDGAEWTIEASQFGAYPIGQDFRGNIREFNYDPADVIRRIWEHLQSFPSGNLGITVVGSTSAKVGHEVQEKMKEGTERERNPDGTFKPIRDDQKELIPVPYELSWVDAPDAGAEIRKLAKDGAFDIVEEHGWVDGIQGGTLYHRIVVGDRLGQRRSDLTFTVGTNVTQPIPIDDDGDQYVSDPNVIGAGEGELSARSRPVPITQPNRLRRARVYDAKRETSVDRLTRMARDLAERSIEDIQIKMIQVTQHDDAPIGSWRVGDEVQINFPSYVKAPPRVTRTWEGLRRNLAKNPVAVTASGFQRNVSTRHELAQPTEPLAHPQGIKTAWLGYVKASQNTRELLSVYDVDGLLNTGPARWFGAWVYPSVDSVVYWDPELRTSARPAPANAWTFVPSIVQLPANTHSSLYVMKAVGNAVPLVDFVYVTGVTSEIEGPPVDTPWGGEALRNGYRSRWVGAANASESVRETLVTSVEEPLLSAWYRIVEWEMTSETSAILALSEKG